MIRVLVVERDELLRETLEMVLDDAGYTVAGVADGAMAMRALEVSPHPLVVLLSHGGRDGDSETVLVSAPMLPPHEYILLSTRPKDAPWVWNAHMEHFVSVVSLPFEVDALLDMVAAAAARLERAAPFVALGRS